MKNIKIPVPKLISVEKLKIFSYNVKIHPKDQIEAIAENIKMVGFIHPILVDESNVILAGHGRLEAAKLLKMKEVPCIKDTEMTEDEKKAYLIIENKLNEMGQWNRQNMKFLLQDLKFDFKPFHMDFGMYASKEETKPIPEPSAEPKSKKGDMYKLGRHMILCGDSTKKEDVQALLGNQKVDQLLTDPPYGVDYGNKNKFLNSIGKGNRIETPINNDSIEDYQEFYAKFLENIQFSERNTVYVFQLGIHTHDLRLAMDKTGYTWSDWLVWKKNNHHVLGRKDYNAKHEWIFYGWKGKHVFYSAEFRTTILEYDKPQSNDLHPTMKPLTLLCQLITDGSEKEMLVYDPFLGSGSTLIACEQTNRVCYGMEIDPAYVDVIITRWENFTNQKAEKL